MDLAQGVSGDVATSAHGEVHLIAGAAAALGGAGVDFLDADAALEAVAAARWAQAAALAVEAAALCRLVAAYPECGLRGRDPARLGVEFELMSALGMSQRSAGNRLGLAEALGTLPELTAALRAGTVDVPTGLMILDKVSVLADPALRREVVARVLAGHAATSGGLTYAQLARLVGRAVATADPTGAARRQAQARRGRFVAHHRPQVAGEEGRLVAAGPAERVAICAETIEAIARGWARAGVSGTLDQLRFDALVALVTGADPTTPPDRDGDPDPDEAGLACPESDPDLDFDAEADVDPVSDPDPDPGDIQGTAGSRGDLCAVAGDPDQNGEDRVAATAAGGDAGVFARPGGSDRGREMCRCGGRVRPVVAAQVTVALSTLVGLDDAPGELAGVGSVPAEVARELAAQAVVWRRLLTDPADGHLVTQVIRSYRPTAAMRRFVLTRAGGVCASRGCTARHGLQIDHDEPFPGGPTSATNNVPLHQPHHDGKTCGAWQHRLDPVTGALRQVSPLGRVYTTRALPPWAGRGTARRVGWTRRRCWPRSWLAGRTRRRSRRPARRKRPPTRPTPSSADAPT